MHFYCILLLYSPHNNFLHVKRRLGKKFKKRVKKVNAGPKSHITPCKNRIIFKTNHPPGSEPPLNHSHAEGSVKALYICLKYASDDNASSYLIS